MHVAMCYSLQLVQENYYWILSWRDVVIQQVTTWANVEQIDTLVQESVNALRLRLSGTSSSK